MYRRSLVAGVATPQAMVSVNPQRRFWAHRRTRRHASSRIIDGRPFWVVPTGLAVGWELLYRNRVLVKHRRRYLGCYANLRPGKGLFVGCGERQARSWRKALRQFTFLASHHVSLS